MSLMTKRPNNVSYSNGIPNLFVHEQAVNITMSRYIYQV